MFSSENPPEDDQKTYKEHPTCPISQSHSTKAGPIGSSGAAHAAFGTNNVPVAKQHSGDINVTFTPIEPARALVPLALLPPPVAGTQTPNHPKPQPWPQPRPIPEPSPTPLPASQPSAPVPCVSWTNTKPINKGKG
ncbi:hypothetical protein RhiTH_008147 [Rhizoctonia solani]